MKWLVKFGTVQLALLSGWQAVNGCTAGVVKLSPDRAHCIICHMKSGHSPQELAEHKVVNFVPIQLRTTFAGLQ